jgi:hypothetical protein
VLAHVRRPCRQHVRMIVLHVLGKGLYILPVTLALPKQAQPMPLRIGSQTAHDDFGVDLAASALALSVRKASRRRRSCR